jgi:hypothetical protein
MNLDEVKQLVNVKVSNVIRRIRIMIRKEIMLIDPSFGDVACFLSILQIILL